MTFNEVRRLNIGFQRADVGIFKTCVPNGKYFTDEARNMVFTFVQQQTEVQTEWVLLASNASCCFKQKPIFGYCKGFVYEAESGQRLVHGQKMSAEDYLVQMRNFPILDMSTLDYVDLVVTVWRKLGGDDMSAFYGWVYDPTWETSVEGDFVKTVLRPKTINDLCFISYSPWCGRDREVQFNELRAASELMTPIMSGSLSLF